MRCARKPTSVKQPKWHSLSTSSTACWRWDARATSASYETTRTRDHCVHRLIHATRSGHGPIVDDQQLDLGELGEQPGGLAVDAGEGELVEKPGEPLIAHREPITRRLVAESASDKAFAGAGRAQDQNVVVLVQPAAAGEAVDQAAVETARSSVVDILEAGGLAQLGKAQTLGERGIVAFDGLAIDQHRQALVEAEAIAVGQPLLLLKRLGHAGEA